MKTPSVRIAIAHIHNKFDVRKSLDETRIIALAELYQAGHPLPPITVVQLPDGEYAFVDGRHRVAALALLDISEVEAVVVSTSDPATLFAMALQANWGGALPPSPEDIRHTVQRLVEAGIKSKVIYEKLGFVPRSLIGKYMSDANSMIKKRAIYNAMGAIAEGMGVAEAAKQFKLDEGELRMAISGRKKKFGADASKTALNEANKYVTGSMKTASNRIAQKIQVLLWKVENGELAHETVSAVIDTWSTRITAMAHRIKDWRDRVDAARHKSELIERGDAQ